MFPQQKRLAICFFGINRSLKWTLKSIERNIFRVLENGGIGFDVFFHTYSLGMIRGNTYAQELNVAIKDAPFVEALAFGDGALRLTHVQKSQFYRTST